VPVRGPITRVLLWSGGVGLGAVGLVGGLSLRAPSLVAVGLAGALAASVAAGVARESRRNDERSIIEAAVQAAGCTVAVLLVLAGIAALAGSGVAVLAVGVALACGLVRAALRGRSTAPSVTPFPAGDPVPELPSRPSEPSGRTPADPGSDGVPAPVWTLATPALGLEWLTTTAALAGRLEPAARQSLVARRAETLDELERRDPDGFARWLAVGPARGSDPSDFVHGGPVLDGPAADTDAA
jgi:hypothetical protein